MHVLTFCLADRYFAIELNSVERVFRAVAITPVADAPRHVLGLINISGSIIPVFGLRDRFSLPEKELELTDVLIQARAGGRTIALLVDAVRGVEEYASSLNIDMSDIIPESSAFATVAPNNEGLVLVEDLERLCTPATAQMEERIGSASQ
jgi:purine-binding chemotaxis protein CheW